MQQLYLLSLSRLHAVHCRSICTKVPQIKIHVRLMLLPVPLTQALGSSTGPPLLLLPLVMLLMAELLHFLFNIV